jgi:ABC-type Co2+ transport system permease subunit
MPHGQIAVGIATSLVNIAIHAVIMAMVSWAAYRTARTISDHQERRRLVLVMMAAVTVLMAAHLVEVVVWALVYLLLDVTPRGEAFYLAFVNYTTLGYGDALPSAYWRLLGPMTAMNGVLLFGWSTAVIYDVLRSVAQAIPMRPTR